MDLKELNQDFLEFQNATTFEPPKHVSQKLIQNISNHLSPNPWKLFAKLSALHLLSALFTLSVCPQFGFRLVGSGMGLMHIFMQLGTYGCMVACGFFFMGTSFLVASVLLSKEEVTLIRNHRGLEASVITFLSLGFLLMVATEEVLVSIAAAWVLGSILGAIAMVEVVWHFGLVAKR